jgi:lathosterol oxidase
MESILVWFAGLSWLQVALLATAGNFTIFFAALGIGHFVQAKWSGNRTAEPAPPVTRLEIVLAASNVLVNSGVTVLLWLMWKEGYLVLRPSGMGGILLDAAVLFLLLDPTMYILHRVAHHPRLYPWMHAWHHRHENPRPLTLFVLHPLETLSFGILWLIMVALMGVIAGGVSMGGILIYLVANLAFGLCGHLGVQPFPTWFMRLPVIRWLAGSQFHATHHANDTKNFGFYSRIWDHLWKTRDDAGSTKTEHMN